MKPLPWCADLARADMDIVAAALAQAFDRVRAKAPGVSRIALRRNEIHDGGEVLCWLHVAVVAEGSGARSREDLEATHPALARELQAAALRWANAWPILHRHAEGDAALESYRAPRPDVVLPAAPTRSAPAPVRAPAPRAPEPPPPPPPAAPAPTEPTAQRSLF